MKRMTEGKEFPSAIYQQIPLDTNWRSLEKIIRFTEDVFRIASNDDEYAQAAALTGLSLLHHRVKDEHKGRGYVEVRRVLKDDQVRAERTPVLSFVEDCHKRGYQWKDIAILTQDNDDVIEISRWLSELRIPFISHSNLDIRTRKVVAELIALLKFLDSPIDSLSFFTFVTGNLFTALLAKRGQGSVGKAFLEHTARTGRSAAGREPLYKAFQELHPGLWEEYVDPLYRQVGYLPLYDLLSGIYATFTPFEILPGEEGALAKLLDVVRTFEEQGSNSIKDFIAFAATGQDESAWQMDAPADVDAVSLMTIHKAKGLERPVVAVVLYEKRRKGSGYYIQEQEEGIRILRITREMAEKVDELKQLYEFDALKQRADDLNQMYVALTRAKEEMYVVGVHSEDPQEPITFLPEVGYEPGSKPAVIARAPVSPSTLSPYHLSVRKPLAPERAQEHLNLFEKRRGDLIHAVLREIEFIAEPLGPSIENAVTAVLDSAGGSYSREQIRASVEGFLKQSGVMTFFVRIAGRSVLREQEICARDGKLFRADRIIVDGDEATVMDFKTGSEEREEEYVRQLKNYMTLAHEALGVHTVRGVLAYVDRQKMRMIG